MPSDPNPPKLTATSLDFSWDMAEQQNLSMASMLRLAIENGLSCLESHTQVAGDGTAERLEGLDATVMRTQDTDRTNWVLSLPQAEGPTFAVARLAHGALSMQVAAASRSDALATRDLLCEAIEPVEEPPEDELMTRFWSYGEHLSVRATHTKVPLWKEVEANYSRCTRQALAPVVRASGPGGGKLVLWHGPPGTGKTTALRALMREWSEWCAAHIVTDPEQFLASGNSYLLNVLLDGGPRGGPERDWKLIVLEDAGELMSPDARDASGQALSRLLNLTDGLLGQTINAIVLVTTNEPLSRLHPAVRRPGRCWAEIEFAPLGVSEANEWLRERGCDHAVERPTPIAELYALLRGDDYLAEDRREFGFGRALAA